MKIPSSNLGRTCCVQKLFLTFRTIFGTQHVFPPCSAKIRASDKDLPVVLLGFFLFNLFTDIGYGNYLLTAPVERNKRQFWKADSEIPVEVEKIDVSDLLSLANTLTNPLAPSKKKKDKTEL